MCGTIGLIVAFQPGLWIGLFSDDAEVARLGTLYLRIVGPAYICFGLGFGLSTTTWCRPRRRGHERQRGAHDCERRSADSSAIYWFDLGVAGFFVAVAAGFCIYAAMLVHAVSGVKTPTP